MDQTTHHQRNREAERRYRQSTKGRASRARIAANRYRRLREQGLCIRCSQPTDTKKIYCCTCAEKDRNNTRKYRAGCVSRKICPNCGKNSVLPSMEGKDWSFCESCYFKKTSTDCLKTAKHAEVIGQKLKDQNYRCAYTGELIILGLNDSLDHVLPTSKYPELRSDPSNVEWVTRKVNCMKWDSTREEFLETARQVVRFADQCSASD